MKSIFHALRTLREYQEIINETTQDAYLKSVCEDSKELIRKIEKLLREQAEVVKSE